MQLLVMNLTDYQRLKAEVLIPDEKQFNIAETLKDIVDIHSVDASQSNI